MAWKKEYGRRYQAKFSQEEKAQRSRDWSMKNPIEKAKISRRYSWKARGVKNFTTDDYEALYASQDGKCAVCGRDIRLYGTNRNDGDACVDHSHGTGSVRGLLCRRCNLGIGFLGDNAEMVSKALSFLEASDAGRMRNVRDEHGSWDVAFLRGGRFQAREG